MACRRHKTEKISTFYVEYVAKAVESFDVTTLKTLKTLYFSLVRPRVEYGSQVWNPYTKRNISRIKSIKLKERGEIGVVFSLNLFPRNPLIAIKTLFNKHNLSLVLI